jgi:hypothetical protein
MIKILKCCRRLKGFKELGVSTIIKWKKKKKESVKNVVEHSEQWETAERMERIMMIGSPESITRSVGKKFRANVNSTRNG